MVASFDLVVCLLLVFLMLVLSLKDTTPPAIQTLGTYAVVMTWEDGSVDDIDLYVRDPEGNICYFGYTDVGLMHLEYDDLGTDITRGVSARGERTVIRGVSAGEYTVNVHAYDKPSTGPVKVRVRLYRLAGEDTLLHEETVTLVRTGDEETAFRFVVKTDGSVVRFNRLPARMVGL
jgi:hypothetical protein